MDKNQVYLYQVTNRKIIQTPNGNLSFNRPKGFIVLLLVGTTLQVGYALCNTKPGHSDKFDASTGKGLALGRAVTSGNHPVEFSIKKAPTRTELIDSGVPHTIASQLALAVREYRNSSQDFDKVQSVRIWQNEKVKKVETTPEVSCLEIPVKVIPQKKRRPKKIVVNTNLETTRERVTQLIQN